MNILIAGGAGFGNSGDEALLRACAEACRRAAPQARLSYLANSASLAAQTLAGLDVAFAPAPRFSFFGPDHHYYAGDDVFRARWNALRAMLVGVPLAEALNRLATAGALGFVDRAEARRTLLAIASADVLVVHGGGILTSATRSRLWEHSLTVEIAAGLGKRVLLRSHQLGPYDSDDDCARAESMLRLACYVSTRDKAQSSVEASRIAPGAHVVDQPDDALFPEPMPENEQTTLAALGLRPGGYICAGYRHNPSVGVGEDCLEKTAAILRAARDLFQLPIILLPQGAFDEPHLEKLAALLDFETRLVRPRNLLFGTMAVASNARLMVACPHHSLIFALRGGVPILSPVAGAYYRFKNTGSMRHFGLEEFVVDIGGLPTAFMPSIEHRLATLRRQEQRIRSGLAHRIRALQASAASEERRFASRLAGAWWRSAPFQWLASRRIAGGQLRPAGAS